MRKQVLNYPYQKLQKYDDFHVMRYFFAPWFACFGLGAVAMVAGLYVISLRAGVATQVLGVVFVLVGMVSCFSGAKLQIDLVGRRWLESWRVLLWSRSQEGDLSEDAEGLEIVSSGDHNYVMYYVTLRWKDLNRSRWVLAYRYDYARACRDLAGLAEQLSLPILGPISEPEVKDMVTRDLPEPPEGSRMEIAQQDSDWIANLSLVTRGRRGFLIVFAFALVWSGFWLLTIVVGGLPGNVLLAVVDAAFALIGLSGAVAGFLLGFSRKSIEVYQDRLDITHRMFGRRWRGKAFHYRAVEELRRIPVPGIGKWILVARMRDRAVEFGKELSAEELAWLEAVVRRQIALETGDEKRTS